MPKIRKPFATLSSHMSSGNVIQRLKSINYRKPVGFVKRRPIFSFLIALGLLLALIVANNFLLKPQVQEIKKSEQAKKITTYSIGSSPKLTLQAQVEKSGVIKITALSPGVVQQINVTEGQEVSEGANLVWMTTNYSGGSAFSVQRQIAQAQYNNTLQTFDTQKDLISKQREVANKADANSDELRDIGARSVDETLVIVGLNEEILGSLETSQTELESTNIGGVNDAAILQTKQLRSQLMSGNNQLRQAVRNIDLSKDLNKPPSQLSDLQKDIVLKQLDVQEKALELQKEVGRLQVASAAIMEQTMHPTAPFAGRIERVHVRVGQAVNPGEVLITLSGASDNLSAISLVTNQVARSISKFEMSTIRIASESAEVIPAHVAQDATDGNLYAVVFPIPLQFLSKVTDKGYLIVDVPVGSPDTSGSVPFVPLDAVFQTQEKAYLYVSENGAAVSREVKLGEVMGRFVRVEEGLRSGDQVILNRNVVAGERVEAT